MALLLCFPLTMDEDVCAAWCELLVHEIVINSTFRMLRNVFEASVPTHSIEEPIEDYEPLLHGLGSFDDPDVSMFAMFDGDASRGGGRLPHEIPMVAVTEVAHAASLAAGDLGVWDRIFSCSSTVTAAGDVDGHFVWCTGDDRSRPLPRNLRHVVFDFGGLDGNASAALLCLLLAMPNLEAASLRGIRAHQIDRGSLFGCFPSPRAHVASMWSGLGLPAGVAVAAKLTSLQLKDCLLPTSDLYFLGDCAVENAVLPALRNIALDNCHGPSYGSIVALAQATNFAFDRSLVAGAMCPQECVNPKNLSRFY